MFYLTINLKLKKIKVQYMAKFGAYYTRKLISLSIFLVVK